jgi:hypothetical protein
LDYIIPKGTSHTSAPDSTYEVQKIEIYSYKENISSIQNYQGLFLYLGFFQLTALCKLLLSNSDGPVAKSSTLMQAALVQIPCINFFIF